MTYSLALFIIHTFAQFYGWLILVGTVKLMRNLACSWHISIAFPDGSSLMLARKLALLVYFICIPLFKQRLRLTYSAPYLLPCFSNMMLTLVKFVTDCLIIFLLLCLQKFS